MRERERDQSIAYYWFDCIGTEKEKIWSAKFSKHTIELDQGDLDLQYTMLN